MIGPGQGNMVERVVWIIRHPAYPGGMKFLKFDRILYNNVRTLQIKIDVSTSSESLSTVPLSVARLSDDDDDDADSIDLSSRFRLDEHGAFSTVSMPPGSLLFVASMRSPVRVATDAGDFLIAFNSTGRWTSTFGVDEGTSKSYRNLGVGNLSFGPRIYGGLAIGLIPAKDCGRPIHKDGKKCLLFLLRFSKK